MRRDRTARVRARRRGRRSRPWAPPLKNHQFSARCEEAPNVMDCALTARAKFAEHVALWTHRGGVPRREIAVVHRESVVVLGDGDDEACAGAPEQRRPTAFGVEMLARECRDEVFVSEVGLRTVGGAVVAECLALGLVHLASIPIATRALTGGLVAVSGNGEHAPVDEDAELAFAIPARNVDLLQAWPVGIERAVGDDPVDQRQVFAVGGSVEGSDAISGHRVSPPTSERVATVYWRWCGSSPTACWASARSTISRSRISRYSGSSKTLRTSSGSSSRSYSSQSPE